MDMRYLIDKLNHYTDLYDQGHPEISDKEWDELYFTLKQEEEKTGVIYPDSPTQHIHYESVFKLNKVTHDHPMLSLDKTKNIQEVNEFLQAQPFVAMFKMDGLTCSLTYEHGELIKAETRGNGIVGEDILHNVKVVKNIPLKIPYEGRLVVDGEIICRKDDFIPFQKEYKNPRNFASGSIRLLSSEECKKRNLSFVAWEMIEGYPDIKEFWRRLDQLYNIGFTIVPMVCDRQWVDEALEVIQDQFKEEHAIYPIDGYVFKFNDIDFGKKQGQTDHHLKNAIAYKLYDETYSTRLKHIQWTMGRTGVLTPVAIFDPIDIDGSTVERASLHNVSVMREILGDCAYVGEPLQVYKANQIIPQIAEAGPKYDYSYVIAHGGVSANDVIERCPICGGDVAYITSDDGVINAYCDNPLCEGKLINRLEHFCGKKGLDIKGLSKATFQKLIDWEWLENLEGVFNLNQYRNEWIKKPGFGIASVDKILKSIEEHRHTTLDAFISAIGIPLIGRTAAKDLTNYFETYEDFRDAVMNDTYNFFILDNFGEEMNNSIKNFNYAEADRISKLLIFETPVVNNIQINNSLTGKTIVITGKLTTFKNRAELKAVIESHGGKVSDSISGKTDLLINNDVNSTSSKNKAAKARNIPIVSELDFMKQYIEN
jgi:DNA ligase (NAD+)